MLPPESNALKGESPAKNLLPPEYDHLKVEFPDGSCEYLNFRLVRSKSLPYTNIARLHVLWVERWKVFNEAKEISKRLKEDHSNFNELNSEYKPLVKKLEELEFAMQEAWLFEKDSRYHKPFTMPGCSCMTSRTRSDGKPCVVHHNNISLLA
jgi:hypothetical protein